MKIRNKFIKTNLTGIKPFEGETIMDKINRAKKQGEPIRDVADVMYTARTAGVLWGHDIRTDKWRDAAAAKTTIDVNKLEQRQKHINKALGLNDDGTPIQAPS